MALDKIVKVTGRAVAVANDDIDTDRIIPARFMKCVTFDGLGQYLFYDVRFSDDGSKKDHPLNDARYAGASILIAGSNFGCGSSREHAPQALSKAGFRAVIAINFAEIFFGNSTTLGMPCVALSREHVEELTRAVEADPSLLVSIDLENQLVTAGTATYPLQIKPVARQALTSGHWDPIATLLEGAPDVAKLAGRLPYLNF